MGRIKKYKLGTIMHALLNMTYENFYLTNLFLKLYNKRIESKTVSTYENKDFKIDA